MKLSELIKQARAIRTQHGDLDVFLGLKEDDEIGLSDIITSLSGVVDDDNNVFAAGIIVEDLE